MDDGIRLGVFTLINFMDFCSYVEGKITFEVLLQSSTTYRRCWHAAALFL